jgi:hypothetical protein
LCFSSAVTGGNPGYRQRRGPRLYHLAGAPALSIPDFNRVIVRIEDEVLRLEGVFPGLAAGRIRFEFHSAAGILPGGALGSPWVGAYTIPGERKIIVQHVALLRDQGILVPVIAHELVHIALIGSGRRPLPLWLEEGMACLHSRELVDAVPVGGMGLAALDAALAAAPAGNEAAWRRQPALLARARHLVRFLEMRLGRAGTVRLCRMLAEGILLPVALAALGGPGPEELEREAIGR